MKLRATIAVLSMTLAAVAVPGAAHAAAPTEERFTVDGLTLQQVRVPRTATPVTGAGETRSDFDGDGRDDIATAADSTWTGDWADWPGHVSNPVIVKYSSAPYTEYLAVLGGGVSFGNATAAGDFDGDGFDDLAIGDPNETDAGATSAGGLWVIPGSAGGLNLRGAKHLNQSTSGVADTGEENDLFGYSLAAGDVNGDGRSDLAVGVPYEDDSAGAVYLFPGSGFGVTATGHWRLTQGLSWLPGAAESGDLFGLVLAIGRVNNNAYADIVISAPGENGNTQSPGMLTLIWGNPGGLNQTGVTSVMGGNFANGGLPMNAVGVSLAVADTNRDGFGEVLAGASQAQVGESLAGVVLEIPGRSTGLSATGAKYLSQATAGVPGEAEHYDAFGGSLATGDLTGDGYADALVGVPGEASGSLTEAGAVVLLKGSAGGLTGTGAQYFDQNSASVPDTAEAGDTFGYGVAVLNVDGAGPLDAVVGTPGEIVTGDIRSGNVIWFHGGSGGLVPQGVSWNGQHLSYGSWRFTGYAREFADIG